MSKKRLIVLSGAGISAESGLGTFRDSGGLWEKYPIEQVATPEAWAKNPALVTEFYNMRRKQAYEAQPNEAHLVLAELEKDVEVIIITQNIDDLHERAGSTNVVHLHGEISKVKSSGPKAENTYYEQLHWEVKIGDVCPDGFQLRPHVVWFGEAVPMMAEAELLVEQADIFLVIGTSLNVYPAASLIYHVPSKCECYLIDPSEVEVPAKFKVIQRSATKGVKLFQSIVLKRK